MQVSVEETSTLGRKMTVAIPAEKIETEISQRLNKLKGQVKIDGFRPGKVPLKLVQQRYGTQVRQEVMADQMQSSYRDAVLQEKLRPASSPQIQPEEIAKDKDLTFVATFDVYPEIELCDFSSLTAEVPTADISDEDINDAIERIRKQRINWQAAEGKAEKDMRATIDFVGAKDGEEFEGGKANDFPLVIGENGMIPGFEDEIVGMSADESKQFNITFPKEYGNADLAGQEVTFDITLKKLEQGELPEVNEDFIKGLGVADGTEEAFHAEIRKSLEAELKQHLDNHTKQVVMELLTENNDFELPGSMVSQEVNALRQQAMQNFSMENAPELPDALFEEEAKQRVKIGLMIGEIVTKEQLQLDNNRVEQRIMQMASQYAEYDQVVQYYRTDRQARASVESYVMEDQVVEWVLEKVNKQEKAQSFKDIVKPR